jgi:hypothetical protein
MQHRTGKQPQQPALWTIAAAGAACELNGVLEVRWNFPPCMHTSAHRLTITGTGFSTDRYTGGNVVGISRTLPGMTYQR